MVDEDEWKSGWMKDEPRFERRKEKKRKKNWRGIELKGIIKITWWFKM